MYSLSRQKKKTVGADSQKERIAGKAYSSSAIHFFVNGVYIFLVFKMHKTTQFDLLLNITVSRFISCCSKNNNTFKVTG